MMFKLQTELFTYVSPLFGYSETPPGRPTVELLFEAVFYHREIDASAKFRRDIVVPRVLFSKNRFTPEPLRLSLTDERIRSSFEPVKRESDKVATVASLKRLSNVGVRRSQSSVISMSLEEVETRYIDEKEAEERIEKI